MVQIVLISVIIALLIAIVAISCGIYWQLKYITGQPLDWVRKPQETRYL
jgi:hypothetical protein